MKVLNRPKFSGAWNKLNSNQLKNRNAHQCANWTAQTLVATQKSQHASMIISSNSSMRQVDCPDISCRANRHQGAHACVCLRRLVSLCVGRLVVLLLSYLLHCLCKCFVLISTQIVTQRCKNMAAAASAVGGGICALMYTHAHTKMHHIGHILYDPYVCMIACVHVCMYVHMYALIQCWNIECL